MTASTRMRRGSRAVPGARRSPGSRIRRGISWRCWSKPSPTPQRTNRREHQCRRPRPERPKRGGGRFEASPAVRTRPLSAQRLVSVGGSYAFGLRLDAISGGARASLLGRGGRLLGQPVYRAAAHCLGDVIAARVIPDKLLLSTELGVGLVAVG